MFSRWFESGDDFINTPEYSLCGHYDDLFVTICNSTDYKYNNISCKQWISDAIVMNHVILKNVNDGGDCDNGCENVCALIWQIWIINFSYLNETQQLTNINKI